MFSDEFLLQIKPEWVERFLSLPDWTRLSVVFLVSWAVAWLVNRVSRWVALWFDVLSRSVPADVPIEEYRKSALRSTPAETFFWTPLFGVAMACVYALFIQRGGIANLTNSFEVDDWTVGLRDFWGSHLFQPLGLQNFIGFFVLSIFLLGASLCDVRRRIIPDFIPLSAIAVGVFLAMATQTLFIPVATYEPINQSYYSLVEVNKFASITFASPYNAPDWSAGAKILWACGCWAFFVFAFTFRPIRLRHGLKRGLELFFLRLAQDKTTYVTLTIAVVGLSATIWSLLNSSEPRQLAVLSSLFGMTFGGLSVWAVRIVGKAALKMESIGFGDVLLMMAIGAYTGWQAIPVIFFLSPATGLIVGVVMLIFGQRYVPLGPFLCITTVIWLLCFDSLWDFCFPLFVLGPKWVTLILLACLGLMAIMLWIIQVVKQRFLYR